MQERAIFRVRSIFMESSDKDGGGNTEPIMGEKIIRPVVADGKKVARWHVKRMHPSRTHPSYKNHQ